MATLTIIRSGLPVLFDEEDAEMLAKHSWRISVDGYVVARRVSPKVSMHRLVAGAQAGQIVDHIDRNRLNNTRANLRIVTAAQSAANRGKSSGSASRFKGVNRHPDGWQVYLKHAYIGLFHSEVEAAIAYNVAALRVYGAEFAVLNDVQGATA